MLKIFATQLLGLFKKIEENEAFSLEDGARLLAQAPAGDGTIYLLGIKEMKAVEAEALQGAEPLKHAKSLTDSDWDKLTDADRAILFSRHANDQEAVAASIQLQDKNIPFVAVSGPKEAGHDADDQTSSLAEFADVHIQLPLTKGLIPDEFGQRFGLPYSMAALFAYYGLKFTLEEILSEYEL